MTTPRFDVGADGTYGEHWTAYTDAEGFRGFEWVWDGGDHVTVGAYCGDLPMELTSIDVSDEHGPVIPRTPEAFAAFLAGRYSSLEATRALLDPWEAQQARIDRSQLRLLRQIRRRRWLWRLTRGRFHLIRLR